MRNRYVLPEEQRARLKRMVAEATDRVNAKLEAFLQRRLREIDAAHRREVREVLQRRRKR
jgi:hypothetical protein